MVKYPTSSMDTFADTDPTEHFELLHALEAFNRIPVYEYVSKRTGLTVCIANVDGPIVNGYFCLATEAFDDDGLPHTLEHLIFLGSENYPFKGVLDLLANRCLASGTNAWTDTDHTCYTMETAGSEGFLYLMPIFLEHILYPNLREEGYITEVHHITGDGDDAGVVYCEMQGRENSAEARLYLTIAKNIYPGRCGYASETGGIMKNLRTSTNNEKVRQFHKDFYRPENLKVLITGQIDPLDIFKALEPLEQLILSKAKSSDFIRPWQTPIQPLDSSRELVIKYPADDERNGLFAMAWRGPSCVTDLYSVCACSIVLKYLTENSISPLPKVFVETDDPFASNVCYYLTENSESCFYILFEDVPVGKLPYLNDKLKEELRRILREEDIDMQQLEHIISKHKLEHLSNIETSPHHTITAMIIGHMLYGNTEEDLEQRINPLEDLDKLLKEEKTYWLNIIQSYFVENRYVSVQSYPNMEEQQNMAKEEKERVEKQRQTLGPEGLKQKALLLKKAIEFNEIEPPNHMLTSVPIPSLESMKYHNVVRYSTNSNPDGKLDLSNTAVYTYFDHLHTDFIYTCALLNTKDIPPELRTYLPLLLECSLELPIEREGKIIPYESVVAELNQDIVYTSTSIGFCRNTLFSCGSYSEIAMVSLQTVASKYDKGLKWLYELLYKTKFTPDRIKVIALKMSNAIAQAKRSGRNVAAYVSKNLWYREDTNVCASGILVQNKFLADIIQKLSENDYQNILDKFECLRNIITDPSNVILYLAGNLHNINNPTSALNTFLLRNSSTKLQPLAPTPDYQLLGDPENTPNPGCVVGLGCIESSFFYQTAKSITSLNDHDLPALMLYMQYLKQAEGPMWRQIRGKGYSYNYNIVLKFGEGLIYLIFAKATNVVGAYEETVEIVNKQLKNKEWDVTLLESAKSSLIFDLIEEENTIGSVTLLSLRSYLQQVDYTYNRALLSALDFVTQEDLNRVGELYIQPLFDPAKVKTAIVTDPAKVNDIADGFKKFGLNLTVYHSLEESFLKV